MLSEPTVGELVCDSCFSSLQGGSNGTTSMEAPRLANRQEGSAKTNPKYKRRSRQPWSDKEVKQLRSLAKANTPTGVISLKMERPPASIASKAQREGISLRPTNRSPYNRRKPAKNARR
jgi:hypothetical protein